MSRVAVLRVSPTQLHGFHSGKLALELQPGLNVVCAPNASGKSTLARSIALLFDPEPCDRDATVAGKVAFLQDGEDGEIARIDDLETIPERNVGPKSGRYDSFVGRSESYRLDVVGMLQGFDAGDQNDLAAFVGNGFDLSAPAFVSPKTEVRQAGDALAALRAARTAKEGTAAIEDGLPALRRAVQEAADAARVVDALRALLARRALQAEGTGLTERIRAIDDAHPGIRHQRRDAEALVRKCVDALETAEDARREADARLRSVHRHAARPDGPLTQNDRDSLEGAVERAIASRGQVETLARTLDKERATADDARRAVLRLAPGLDPTRLPEPSQEDVRALRTAVAEHDRLRADALRAEAARSVAESWRKAHPGLDEGVDLDATIDALRDWLVEKPAAIGVPEGRSLPIFVAAVAAGVAAALPVELPIRLGIAAVAIVVAAFFAFRKPSPSAPVDRRGQLAAAFPREMGLESPSVVRVVATIRTLAGRLAAREVGTRLDEMGRAAPAAPDWEAVAARLNLVAVDPCSLSTVASAMLALREAVARHDAARAELATAQAALDAAEEDVRSVYRAYAYPEPTSRPEGEAGPFKDWFDLAAKLEKAESDRKRREDDLARSLADSGVPADALSGLQALRERASDANRREEAETRLVEIERELGKVVVGAEAGPFEGRDDAGVRGEIARSSALAGELSAREKAVWDAERTVGEAERKAELLAKEEAYEAALSSVESKGWRMVRRSVAVRLRSHLAARQRATLPPLVQAANEHLAAFSGERYRLALADKEDKRGLGRLTVEDAQTGRSHPFAGLSSGTKVHVVVALRVALIEANENRSNGGDRRFPLIVDEALAISDPDASAAVARTLFEVARTRQVVVFTNCPDDLRAFREVAAELAGVCPAARSMAEPSLGTKTYEVPAPLEMPAYGVPQGPTTLDLWLPVSAHAGAILPGGDEAPTILHAKRRLGPELRRFVDILESLREAYAAAHPRCDWPSIEDQSWARTPAKKDDVRRLIQGCGGCGSRFVRALEAERMGPRFVEKAQLWLEDKGLAWERPARSQIRETVGDAFGPEAPQDHVDRAVALLDAAFGSEAGVGVADELPS